MSEFEVGRHDLQPSHVEALENSPEFRSKTSQQWSPHGTRNQWTADDTISEVKEEEKKLKEESAEAQTVKEQASAAEQTESQSEPVKDSEPETAAEESQSEESEQTETQTETQTENDQSEGDEKAEEPKKSFLDEYKEKYPKEDGEDDESYLCRLYISVEARRTKLLRSIKNAKDGGFYDSEDPAYVMWESNAYNMSEALEKLEDEIQREIPRDAYGTREYTVEERLKEARNVSAHKDFIVKDGESEASQEEKEAEPTEEKVEEEVSEETSEDKAEPEKPEEPQEPQLQQDSDEPETKDELVEGEQSKPKPMKLPNEQQRKPEKPIDIEIGDIAFDNSHFSWKGLGQSDKSHAQLKLPRDVVNAFEEKLSHNYPYRDRIPSLTSIATGAVLSYLRDGDRVVVGSGDTKEEYSIDDLPIDHNTKTIFLIFSGLSGYSAVLDNQLAADKKLDKLAADFRRISGRDVFNEQVLRSVELMLGWLIADRFGFPDEEGESLDRMQATGQGYERMSFEVKSIETVLRAVEETMTKQWEQSKEAEGREIHKDRGKANDAVTGKNPEGGAE